ncbi:MAG: potassium transporter Kup [Gammaproteobacteria bacterium]
MLATLGVVFGDIGTSPIYALRTCFGSNYAISPTPGNIYGILSLILWALIIVVSLKYVIFMLQADNNGEGGTFALLALIGPWRKLDKRRRRLLVLFGLLGASLLYGDMMITPSISILSAVEGVKVADPHFQSYVIPVTIAILVLLFVFQRRGTARIGRVFGPIMLLWFTFIAALGIKGIVHEPRILAAASPLYAVEFFVHNHVAGFLVLSAVILAITGSEALYADLGHFGRPPIRLVWFGFVLPAVLLNYFGQGALLLGGASAKQPFFHLAPGWLLYPLVAVATAATIIASQATITGAFSLTRQAVQLGQMPRMKVLQTSTETQGQIYIPAINWVLMIATIGLVLLFRSSSNLTAAYGVAVNAAMVVTTVLAFNVARERGGWSRLQAIPFLVLFLAVDLSFLSANMTKIPEGGWFSISVGALFFGLMWTWRRGRQLQAAQLKKDAISINKLLKEIGKTKPARVAGAAVFVSQHIKSTPPALHRQLHHLKTLHKQVILLSVLTENKPRVTREERVEAKSCGKGIWRIVLHYGYMQEPNIPSELKNLEVPRLKLDLEDTTYFIGRTTLLPSKKSHNPLLWRDRLFAFMSRNSVNESTFYRIPSDQVVEIGLRVRL